jgi:hypothetical protein
MLRRNCLLKHVIERREEEEDVNSYWRTVGKEKITEMVKRKH